METGGRSEVQANVSSSIHYNSDEVERDRASILI